MLLNKLKDYADERMQKQPPPCYATTPVAWIVALDPDGRPLSREPISRIDPNSPRGKRGRDLLAPEVTRTSATVPLLLADKGEYTFGRALKPDDPKMLARAQRRHTAYLELLGRCANATNEPAVLAVQRFYERGGADELNLGDEWDYGQKITFEVLLDDGTLCRPIDLASVQQFWLSVNAPASEADGQCLVCGDRKPVLDRLQANLKGIRGGQSSGTSLISANSAAFESYGLDASRNAPTCRECGEAFTRAANDLLADERSHLVVGDTTFIFWTQKTQPFDVGRFMRQPDPSEVKALLESVHRGQSAGLTDDTAFYAAALSGSGGRAVVRDWIDTTVGTVAQNITRWFVLQRVTDPRPEDPTGENPRPLDLFALAASTVRDVAKDRPVTTLRALFRAALVGAPLPLELAYQAVRRCRAKPRQRAEQRAEPRVTRSRAALIKLVLLSQERQPPKEEYMVALEPVHPSPAYHCGRLLAVLESVQRAALPRVNTTIVDRYYGAASSTPGIVFGTLLRGAQPHLAKLKRDRPGANVNLQRRIEEICAKIGDWPATLALKDQALFSLGYYHQRAHDRAEASSRRAASGSPLNQDDMNADSERKTQQ